MPERELPPHRSRGRPLSPLARQPRRGLRAQEPDEVPAMASFITAHGDVLCPSHLSKQTMWSGRFITHIPTSPTLLTCPSTFPKNDRGWDDGPQLSGRRANALARFASRRQLRSRPSIFFTVDKNGRARTFHAARRGTVWPLTYGPRIGDVHVREDAQPPLRIPHGTGPRRSPRSSIRRRSRLQCSRPTPSSARC